MNELDIDGWPVVSVGDGPAVLLLHGGGLNAAALFPLAVELRRARVVLVDLPGHGLNRRDEWDWPDVHAGLDRVCSATGLEFPLVVGHSLGGLAAWSYASTRGLTAVNIDGWVGDPWPLYDYPDEPPLDAVLDPTDPRHVDGYSTQLRANGLTEEQIGRVVRRATAVQGGLRALPPRSMTAMQTAMGLDMSALARTSTGGLVLVLSDEGDDAGAGQMTLRRDLAVWLAENAPQVSVRWLQGDHNVVLSRPAAVARLALDVLSGP